jgi:serine protease Do
VLSVDQQPVRSFDDLKNYIQRSVPGEQIQVLVQRNSETLPLTIRLGQSPQPPHSEDDAKLLQTFLLHVVTGSSRMRSLPDMSVLHVGKNHEQVKDAARPAAETAKFSVAKIVADGRPVGLATVVDHSGYLVTKASEIDGAGRVECRFYGGRHLDARPVAVSTEHDLVLLKVDADDLVPVQWADPAEPAVGTWVASISTSDQLLAVGNVSCAPRPVDREDGFLGVQLEGGPERVLVQQVLQRSAAETAGMREGDRILSVNSSPVTSTDQFIQMIRGFWPGDEITLQVQRGSQRLELSVHLIRQSDMEAEQSGFGEFLGSELSTRRSGFPLVLQHDTVVLPEFCGGPIVTLEGECVGVNIARAERVSSYALPVQVVKRWVEDAISAVAPSDSPMITTARPVSPPASPGR